MAGLKQPASTAGQCIIACLLAVSTRYTNNLVQPAPLRTGGRRRVLGGGDGAGGEDAAGDGGGAGAGHAAARHRCGGVLQFWCSGCTACSWLSCLSLLLVTIGASFAQSRPACSASGSCCWFQRGLHCNTETLRARAPSCAPPPTLLQPPLA